MASHLIFKCRHEHHEPSPLFSTFSNIIIIITIIIVIITIIYYCCYYYHNYDYYYYYYYYYWISPTTEMFKELFRLSHLSLEVSPPARWKLRAPAEVRRCVLAAGEFTHRNGVQTAIVGTRMLVNNVWYVQDGPPRYKLVYKPL